ncbi:MAG: putative manganese transporter [Pseudomonadota bacterium]|nr:putative manganese transporter [Pseudomonadota bacterium]
MNNFANGLQHSIIHAIMITGFVAMMMVLIEYLNILSRGVWQKKLRGGRWKQYLLASFLGATPGCLGAFAAVSLYSHREISLGALVAAMIATSGDESFIMLSLIPKQAPLIFIILLFIGLGAGFLTDMLIPEKMGEHEACSHKFDLHEEDVCRCFPWGELREQWHHCSFIRGMLCLSLSMFLFTIIAGKLGPPIWNWIRVTLVIVSSTALFVVSTVPDHFLKEHLWKHVVMNHVPRVFLWTFGTLLLMHLLLDQLQLEVWLQEKQLIVLLVACLVGLIPESGPHLIFLTLYVEGTIPLSIFLASSAVQDGHGMLPLLAESRKNFLKVKLINLSVGLFLGLIGYFGGW